FSTTSADAWLNLYNKGYFWSTTSALAFLDENEGLAWSTTSANYWKSINDFFSTTSASYFLAQNQGNAFSTTSADYWETQQTRYGTSDFQTDLLAGYNAIFGNSTSTNSTSTSLYTTTLGLNSEYFTDLTGSGLTN